MGREYLELLILVLFVTLILLRKEVLRLGFLASLCLILLLRLSVKTRVDIFPASEPEALLTLLIFPEVFLTDLPDRVEELFATCFPLLFIVAFLVVATERLTPLLELTLLPTP